MSGKKGSKLPNPLEGLKPTDKRKCEFPFCGKVREVKDLTVVYYVGDIGKPPEEMKPTVCCKGHYPLDFGR